MVEPIVLINPVLGEKWEIGTTQNITWTSDGTCGNDLLIHLFKNNIWLLTIGWNGGTGSYMWDIPSTLIPGVDYSIKIEKNGDYTCGNWETWTRKFEIMSIVIPVICTDPVCNLDVT